MFWTVVVVGDQTVQRTNSTRWLCTVIVIYSCFVKINTVHSLLYWGGVLLLFLHMKILIKPTPRTEVVL
jgi:hypothetical protein